VFMCHVGAGSPFKLGDGDGVSAGRTVDTPGTAVRLQKMSIRFLVPFCVVLRGTLCDATLERVTVY
jgi:hypothetical protein